MMLDNILSAADHTFSAAAYFPFFGVAFSQLALVLKLDDTVQA